MRIIALNTSPNKDGLTARCAEALLAGAQQSGAEVELVHLNELAVELCRACGTGWGTCRSEGNCVQEDAFEEVRQKILAADAWALVTPVYYGDLSESAKAFVDRLRRCNAGGVEERSLQGKDFIGVAAAGGSGRGIATCLAAMDRTAGHLGLRVADLIGVTRRNRAYMINALRAAGHALVEQPWEG